MNDIARCVADLDEMIEVDAPFRDARLDHLAGLGERDLSRILDPVELFAFLVESVEVVVQVEIESRHGSVSAAARFGCKR